LAIPREKKEKLVTQYADMLSRSQAVILTDYRGLSTAEIGKLRSNLREKGCGYHVVKNTLTKLALRNADLPPLDDLLEGPTAIGFCYEEVPGACKVLVDFAEEIETFTIKGGLLGARFIDVEAIKELARLPSREILLAQVLGTIRGPSGRVVGAVTSVIRSILYILKVRVEELEKRIDSAKS
jgi:large subunit ribosomal protein L10